MINYAFLIGTLLLSLYFFYKLKTQKQHKGLNGFSAGAFLVIFIYKAAPICAGLIKPLFF